MPQKIPFRHASINLGAGASSLFGPQTTADTMGATGGDIAMPDGDNPIAPPKYGYDGHPVMAALDYILNGGRGHAVSNQAQYGLQSSAYLQQLQQQGALNNHLAEMQASLDQNPTLLKQQNDAAQALAAAQRTGADNRLQTTLDRLQQYNFSGNANEMAPLRSTTENPYTTATDLDTLYGQPEINSIGLNRSRALAEGADNSTIASLSQRPYIPSITTSQAGADIYGNMFRAAQGQYGSAATTAKIPNAPLEGQSQQLAAITGNNKDATQAGQTTAYLQSHPNFVGQGMQSGQDELRARIGTMNRFELSPSMMGVFTDGNNHVTGSVVNPAPLPGMLPPSMGNTYKDPILNGSANVPLATFSNSDIDNHSTNSAPNPTVPSPIANTLGIPAPTVNVPTTTANQSPSAIDFNSSAFSPYIDPQTGKYVGPQETQQQTLKQKFNKWLTMQGLYK